MVRLLLLTAVFACGLAGIHLIDDVPAAGQHSVGAHPDVTSVTAVAAAPIAPLTAPDGHVHVRESAPVPAETCVTFAALVGQHAGPATTAAPTAASGGHQGGDAPTGIARSGCPHVSDQIGLCLTGLAVRRT